jgi:hypothetical protein
MLRAARNAAILAARRLDWPMESGRVRTLRAVGAIALVAWALVVLAAYAHGWSARFAPVAHLGTTIALLLALLSGAWGVGSLFVAELRLDVSPPTAWRLAFGLAALSYAWLVLGASGLFVPMVAWTLLVVLGAMGALLAILPRIVPAGRLSHRLSRPPAPAWPELPPSAWAVAGLALAGVVIVLPMALAPPVSTDELTYHLAVPKWWCEAGRIVSIDHIARAWFPFQQEMLYTWALLLREPVLAKLVHFSMGLVAAAIAATEARRRSGPVAGACAAAVLLTTPAWLLDMSWAWADVATSLYVLAGTLLLLRLRDEWTTRTAVAAGLLWGMALGTKYTALLHLALALPICLWQRRPTVALARRARLAALAAGIALALLSPYLLRNALEKGNPVHPIGDAAWGRGTLVNEASLYEDGGHGTTLLERMEGSVASVIANRRADDNLGFLPLLLVPALVFVPLASASRRLHVLGAASALILGSVAAGSVRFQLPALALLAVPMGEGLASWITAGSWRRTLAMLTLLVACGSNLAMLAWHDRELFDPVRVALGYENQDSYLHRMEPSFDVLRRIDLEAPPGSRVLALSADRLFWLDTPVIASSALDVSVARDWIREAGSAEAFASRLRHEGVTRVLFARENFRRDVREGGGRVAWTDGDLAILDDFLDRVAQKDVRNDQFELYVVPPAP